MSQSNQNKNNNQQRVIDLNVNGHLMSLDAGLYCVYHAPGQVASDEFGFPGLRVSLPPFKQSAQVSVETFEKDGWLGAEKNAALVRISGGPGLILVTVYQNPAYQNQPPKLQVVRLNDAPDAVNEGQNVPAHSGVAQQAPAATAVEPQPKPVQVQSPTAPKDGEMKVVAHVQRMGDISVKLGEWIGLPDSKTWVEGFGISLDHRLKPEDVEYQAVLGKGWLSPWYKGNQFCGSRGMALPLCGLRVRLSETAAKKYKIRLSATFVDGTKLGPVEDDTVLSAESVAPLEAVRFELISVDGKEDANGGGTKPATIKKTGIAARTNVRLKGDSAKAAAKIVGSKVATKTNPKKK